MRKILIIGGGGHARSVIDVIETSGDWEIAGLVDPSLKKGSSQYGYPVLGNDDDLAALRRCVTAAHVAVGQIKSPAPRILIFDRLRQLGYEMPTIISRHAHVSRSAQVGEGSIVMHFACIGPGTSIDVNTIVNSRALVEHDCIVGKHCHIATAAVLNGHVTVGDASFVGSGACVQQGMHIGHSAVVGMGVTVRRPVADLSVFVGELKQGDA